ncbi:MAG: NMD3-related protein, partial [Candidatus Aenigmatarchaeota archaeon]
MREKFCPKCGKRTEKFYENLCAECFLSSFSISKLLPEKIVVRRCKSCEKFFLKNFFGSKEEVIENFLKKFLEKHVDSISYRIFENHIELNLKKKFYDLEKSEEKTIQLIEKRILCKA